MSYLARRITSGTISTVWLSSSRRENLQINLSSYYYYYAREHILVQNSTNHDSLFIQSKILSNTISVYTRQDVAIVRYIANSPGAS